MASSKERVLLSNKIKQSKTIAQLNRAEQSVDRIYDAGFMTTNEVAQLYDMIYTRKAKMETCNERY